MDCESYGYAVAGGIDDWGFLRTCDTLEHLIVSGAQVTADDWSPISECQ